MSITLDNWAKQKCAANGGTEEWYVYQICDRESFTLANGVITDITMKLGKKAYTWTPDMQSGSATDVSTRSRENNSYFVAQTGMIIFKDDLVPTVELVEQVAKGFLGVIIKKAKNDMTFSAKHYGLVNGMTVETAETVTGQLYEDLCGSTINLVGKELSKAPSVPDSVIQTILVPTS